MNTNFEIYNYLNLINRRVAKAFRSTGRIPLPANFKITTETIKERLYLNQMQSSISYPEFLFENNRNVKKRFKASVKQIKQLQAMLKDPEYAKTMSPAFLEKFSTYLKLRLFVTNCILKEFKHFYFNECDAYEEICAIDTIFFELLDDTFEPDFDVRLHVGNLENKYKVFYQERVSRLEEKVSEKTKKKRAEKAKLQQEAVQLNQKALNEYIQSNTKTEKKEAKEIKAGIRNEKKEAKIKKSQEIHTFKQEKEQKINERK